MARLVYTDKKERRVMEMELLEERIRRDGVVDGQVLKVNSFLNHQMDIGLFNELGREFYRLFGGERVTKLLTIEASGIGIACIAAQYFRVPVVFAKKNRTSNLSDHLLTTLVPSFTHGTTYQVVVDRAFLSPTDRVLLIDDFLANGAALEGLWQLVRQAGGTVVGAGVAIEKAFQPGGQRLRQAGLRVEALARISAMEGGSIQFVR